MSDAQKPERWWRYATTRRGMVCPDDHPIKEFANFPEHGFLRCHHFNRGGAQCEHWVFVLAIRVGGVMLAQVDLQEIRDMERRELTTPSAILEYLLGQRTARIALSDTQFRGRP